MIYWQFFRSSGENVSCVTRRYDQCVKMECPGFTQQFRPLGYKEIHKESLNLNLIGLMDL